MMWLEQLFLEDQFYPLEIPQQPLSTLLATPLQKKDTIKRAQKRKQSNT